MYYAQAISGQLEILAKRRPVEEVLADPATPPEIRRQLELVLGLRRCGGIAQHLLNRPAFGEYLQLSGDSLGVIQRAGAAAEDGDQQKRGEEAENECHANRYLA